MNDQDFLRIAKEAFSAFLEELGFAMDQPSISGRCYRASYTSSDHAVWVSYEPGNDALFVMVFNRKDGELSEIDDREKTLRLADLNRRYTTAITNTERAQNESFFDSIEVGDKEQRGLLKAAKELRLVLPKYLAERSMT